MNARKNVRVTMITSVVELFQKDKTAYAHAPALAEDVLELNQVATALNASLEKAEMSTTDMTTAKQALRAQVTTKAKKMIGVGSAYAVQKKDTQLNDQLKQSGKKIDKAKDNDLPLNCSNLVKLLRTINPEDLAKRGVTAADIGAFEAQVAQFKGHIPQNESARGLIVTENNNSETLTVQACAIVNDRIAPTLLNIKDNVPVFYALFDQASTIRKPATTNSQLKFVFIDDATGEKVEDVVIRDGVQTFDAKKTLKKPSNSKKAQKIASAKGTAKTPKVATTAEATRTLSVQSDVLEIVKEGYETYQLPKPKFKRGKITTITVRLTPIQ